MTHLSASLRRRLLLLLAGLPLAASAQTLTSHGGTLVVRPGGILTVRGGLAQTGAALLRTSGSVAVTGNVQGAATATLDLSTGTLDVTGNVTHAGPAAGSTGTLRLSGPGAQILTLNNNTVPNLTVDKPSGAATLIQPMQVRQVLTMANAGNLALNGQPLTLRSDAIGTALVVNSGTGVVTGGTATMQRYLTTTNLGLGYRHYASPVSGNAMSDLTTPGFSPAFDQGYNASLTPNTVSPFPTVFGYDQSRLSVARAGYASAVDYGWFAPAGTAPMTPGQGYAVNIAGTQVVDFVGTFTTGDLTRSLGRAANDPAADGWHLVGNPYPAPLDFSLIAPGDRTGLENGMHVFESSARYGGSYRSFGNGIGDPFIGSSQGFWVRVASGQPSGSLTFRNSQRLTSFANQVAVRRGASDLRPQVQLRLAGAGRQDDVCIYCQAGATIGYDPQFDLGKLSNPSGLNVAAIAANTGEQLAIQGLPVLMGATVVPLTVQVPAAGSYAFSAPLLANLPATTQVLLVDNLTGTRTDLRTLPATGYAFAVGAAQPLAGRFYLNLLPAAAPLATSAAALQAQLVVYPNPAQGQVTVLRPLGQVTGAVLLNSLGQVMQTLRLPTAETRIALTGLASGVYTLRFALDGQPLTRRLVID